jgi:hypothetical protein
LVESLSRKHIHRPLAYNRKLLMMPSKKLIKKPVKLLFKPFSVQLQNRQLKMPLLFLTWKAMKSKARSLVVKAETSGLLKQQQV